MDYGATNDESLLIDARIWRESAMADGWTAAPLFPSEPVESMCLLSREGWTVHIASRTDTGKWKYQAQVTAWGPDGLVVSVPRVYPGFEALKKLLNTCNVCKTPDVQTTRYSDAGRCCVLCRPEAQKAPAKISWAA